MYIKVQAGLLTRDPRSRERYGRWKCQFFPVSDYWFCICIFCIFTCTYTACILVTLIYLLYHIIALDNGSKARYVYCQNCNLNI